VFSHTARAIRSIVLRILDIDGNNFLGHVFHGWNLVIRKGRIHQFHIIAKLVAFQDGGAQTLHDTAANLPINQFFVDHLANVKSGSYFKYLDAACLHVHFDFNRVGAESPDQSGGALTGFGMQVGQTVGNIGAGCHQRSADARSARIHIAEGNLFVG